MVMDTVGGQAEAGEVAVAELEDAGGEPELGAVGAGVADGDEGVEEAAGRGAGQSGGVGYLGESLAGSVGVERPDDGEAADERLDVGGVRCAHVRLLSVGKSGSLCEPLCNI